MQDATDAPKARSGPSLAHDRREQRTAQVVLAQAIDFPGLAAIGRVISQRSLAGQPEPDSTRWFLLSTPLSPERLLEVARTHWSIENQLHWVLDVDLGEDAARSRKDNAPQNLALLRKLALNILRTHPDKASIKGKIKKAGWDDTFLISLITHMR